MYIGSILSIIRLNDYTALVTFGKRFASAGPTRFDSLPAALPPAPLNPLNARLSANPSHVKLPSASDHIKSTPVDTMTLVLPLH